MNCKNLKILRIIYCNNVRRLEACLNTLEFKSSQIYASSIVHILEKSGTLLQRLKLESKNGVEEQEEEEELKMRVMQFAKILPLTLQYLDLSYSGLSSYIDILLNNCDAPLKNLLINHLDDNKTIKALIKFCIRKRTLNYVGISIDTDSHIKKEVEVYIKLVPSHRITVYC
ncbi:hypothetical protein F8M41_012258 [Gigaspora margarita]|uniref:Uncharacterized protein n=1 Tax=Gigaspora margarita TaxID=4874 RepID=A0A8H4B3U7_GIGMA|nr:hypothetical protein F8M41_012258 [Gigaspora margarita]